MILLGHIDIPCNLCGSQEYKVYALDEDHCDLHPRRVKCKKCSLVYANPLATFDKLEEYYSNTFPGDEKSFHLLIEENNKAIEPNKEIFRELNKNQPPGKFLDIGCSTGYTIDAANQMGWEGYGVELSKQYCDYSIEVAGLKNIYRGDLYRAEFPDNFFDYVLSWHTIEHVPDAKKLLLEIHRITKKDCKLRIGTPHINNFSNWSNHIIAKFKGKHIKYCTAYEHTYEFTPKTIKRMLNECGFEVEKLDCYYPPWRERIRGDNWKGKLQSTIEDIVSFIFPETKGIHMEIICKKI